MKNTAILSLAFIGFCFSAFAGWVYVEDAPPPLEVLNVHLMQEYQFNQFKSGDAPHIVVECPVNTVLPMNFVLKGNLFTFSQADPQERTGIVQFEQTVYLKQTKQELLFSTNLVDWKPIATFIAGQVSAELNMGNDNYPRLIFEGNAYRRP